MSSQVTVKGPLFHEAHQLLAQLETELSGTVASAAERVAQANLHASLKHPTGAYESRVTVDRAFTDRADVTDQGVVYGPWLEGVSSRNTNTRFKGYQSFRRATQLVNSRVEAICAPVVALTVGRFNR